MQIKLYHILIFIGVIVTASVLVFPDRHFIVSQLIESGRLSTARKYINRFTREQPDDALLFIMSANIHLIEGRPDKAIDALKPFLSHQNVSKDHLLRLAQLYEWERDPKNALSVLERTVEVFPHDIYVWNRLINYYRYFGLIEDEVRGIIGLTQLNNKISQKNFFLRIIDPKMLEIANLHLKSNDPMTAYLLSKLHIVRNNLVSDIDDQSLSEKDKKDAAEYAMTRIIEIYVYADLANDIKTFASNLDRQLRSGFKYRMTLMNVMRWADLDNEAIAYLWQLHQKAPNYPEILEQIVNISRENGQLSMAIDALKHLRQMHPNQSNYGEQLAQLYIESEQYQDVLTLYQQLMAQFPNKDYAVLMLKSAINSGQQSLMVEAITVAESIINKSSRLLRNMIDIYLNIEKTQLAFDTGLKYLQHQQNITLNILNKMLEIAIWTNAPENITRSITLIQNYFPDNKELIQKSAEAYLAINKPKDAYLLYGKIVHHMHNDRGFLLKYMESASFTQVPEIMASAALTSARLSPSDYLIIEKSVQLLQWTNQPEKAYDIHLQWLKNNVGSTRQAQQLLKLAQESGDPDRVKEAINLCHSHMPQDSGTQLAIAQQAMASGLNKEAIFAYESYLRHNKQDTQIKRQLAELYVWDGQHEMAFALYKELFKTFPDDTAIQNKMIEIAGWTQNADAISYLMAQKANMSPSNYELQVKAGEAHIAAGQTQESIVFFERALEIKPGNLDLLRKLAQYYGWIERYDDIVRILDMIQQYGRLTQKERIQLAVAAMDRNQPKKVISLLESLANKQLLSETSGILLATAYVKIGQQEKAIRIYKQLASQYQDDPHLMTEMGNQLLWMKQHDLALSFFHKALKEDSKHLNALKGCAQIYAWQNQSKKAIKYFERYLTLKPDDYEVRYQIGELLFTSGNKHYAFKHFQKALTLIDRNKRTLGDDAVKQLP